MSTHYRIHSYIIGGERVNVKRAHSFVCVHFDNENSCNGYVCLKQIHKCINIVRFPYMFPFYCAQRIKNGNGT